MASFEYSELRRRLPGYVATVLCILITTWWTTFMLHEMFFEGWYLPFEWLWFLLPGSVCLTLTLIALTWPRFGGWLLIAIGLVFNVLWWWRYQVTHRFGLSVSELLTMFCVSGLLALVGVLFLFEARRRRRATAIPDPRWWRRNLRYLVAVGVPLLLGLAVSIEPLIRISGRVDDRNRGERLIEGDGVALAWAPAGPGWGDSAGAANWNQIALYGLPPVGFEGKEHGRDGRCTGASEAGCATAADLQRYNICRYLDKDGTHLLDSPEDFWRMPAVDELVRSLVRHGENAGCAWNGNRGPQPCDIRPDKETPLWNPVSPAVGYWSAEDYDACSALLVDYSGRVVSIRKIRGENFGFRCVRAP